MADANMGVVTRIDGTDGDVSIFRGIVFAQDEGGRVDRVENYSPSQIRTEVVSGDTPHILTSNRYLNEAAINTATPLDSPIGAASVVPDVGDIVVRYRHDAGGNWNAAVSALYSANPSFI